MKNSRFLEKMAQKLFLDPGERSHFSESVLRGESAAKAAVWLKHQPGTDNDYPQWQPGFVTTTLEHDRQAHERGDYYAMDLSSVFMASICAELPSMNSDVLVDMCASPGGKSVFLWKLLNPSLVISNETIGHRLPALISNLKRCSVSPVRVTSIDSRKFAHIFPLSSSLVFIDAPCSGQSLLSRGQKSSGAFHPSTINLNMNRQKRILSECTKIVPRDGHIAYSTCTFSIEENEEIVEWFLKRNPNFQAIQVIKLETFQSNLTEIPCYRLFPHQNLGSGGFCALFKKMEGEEKNLDAFSNLIPAWQQGEWP